MFLQKLDSARGQCFASHRRHDARESDEVAGCGLAEIRGLERRDESLGHWGPRHIVPLDRDDHGAVIGLADGEAVEMGDAGNRRSIVQLGHDLGALLKGEGVVFVLAVRGLEDKLALTGNVPELRRGRRR